MRRLAPIAIALQLVVAQLAHAQPKLPPRSSADLVALGLPGPVAGDHRGVGLLKHREHNVVEAVPVELRGHPQPALPRVLVIQVRNVVGQLPIQLLGMGGCRQIL